MLNQGFGIWADQYIFIQRWNRIEATELLWPWLRKPLSVVCYYWTPQNFGMTFRQIANRLTGFSTPLFGVTWTPAKLEIDIARRVLIFLEDRRVLYEVYELEIPRHCMTSIIEIREFLTNQMFDLDDKSELANIVRAMRSTCRKFLNGVQEQWYFDKERGEMKNELGMGGQIHFYNAMGELRATMGILIARMIVMHKLDFEGELIKILPFEIED